ncbi:ribbon-helix-helix domain-containing protein [Streptomyces sp. NBC_00727]|uniref:ribbon-helix-helix domain-containing protein n=1 Tax=Streptomyces sp. NBC_00727 TaxID=2903675 RepID=UPI00386A2BDF
MATERISISLPAELRARIRQYAADAGLSVSAYMVIAARAYMNEQDRARRAFERVDEARPETEASWQETHHLLHSPANARRLRESVAEAEAGG